MNKTLMSLSFACAALFSTTAIAADIAVPRTPSPPGAKVYFITPKDGEQVPTTFVVRFGLEGMGVAPAGIEKEKTGHHHLLIDTDLPADMAAPMGQNIKHFGGGQTETSVTLEPGKHTLQLLLGDRNHIPHDPPVHSEKITVMVVAK